MTNPSSEIWRVLLVDDDEEDYLITREMLNQSRGLKIKLEWAPTFQNGRQLLQSNHYHAVLVDYDLGSQSGIELIREMVARGYPAPLILYTGRGSYEVDIEAMEAGASLYLTKGDANPLMLERFIRYAIERKRIEVERDHHLQERSIILESIQDGLLGVDRNWRISYINTRAARNGGFEPEELVGRNIWEAFPKLQGTPLEENYRRAMAERTPIQFEMHGAYQDQWYNVSVYPSTQGISVYWQEITERKRAEETLRFSEERFNKAFNATPDALVVSRLEDGCIELINESFERLFGYSRAEVIGKTSLQLNMIAHPTDRDEMVKRIQADHFVRNFETDIRIKSGEIRHARLSIEMLTIEGEVNILTIIEDVTERRQAVEAFAEREEMLHLALSAGRAGVWSWDLSTSNLQWSDEYYQIFGFEPGSIPPSVEAGFSHVHPDDLPGIEAVVHKATERGTEIDVVHRVIWPDGSIHWVRGISRPFYDEQGQPCRMAGIAIDITEQKQAEIELQAAHRRTNEILESISDAFYSLDAEGRFTYVNQRASSLWGKQPGDLLGKNIWEVFPSGKETESYWKIQQALEEKQPAQYESYSAFLDQWVDIHLYPTEHGISVYFQEITGRKRAEATLANYAQDLERSNRDLQEFAFVASHDLQEPLRKIEAFGNLLLKKQDNLDESQRDLMVRMQKSASRMRSMIDGLLQLSRLETLALPFQPVDLNTVIAEVLSDLEFQIRRSGGEVEVLELPVIDADPLQMHRLMQNLINNALKFQPKGGKPSVKVSCVQRTPASVQIRVEDNGIGFDEELAGSLFSPFKRLVGNVDYEGSGIGLSICRKIVERHHGEITARSQRGQGTTFMITLPVHQNSSKDPI